MPEIPCIFCKTWNTGVIITENGYRGVKCPSCDLIYISPRPEPSEILRWYNQDEKLGKSLDRDNYGGVSGWVKSLPARQTYRLISRYRRSGELLELGPGEGHFLATLQRKGFQVSGIEVNAGRAEFIRKILKIPCTDQPLGSHTGGARLYDVIYHRDVLSHFYDPVAEFHTMHNYLKEGGLLVFETGNLGEAEAEYLQLVTRFDYPEHLFFFGEKSLSKLLEATGFELIKICRYPLTIYLGAEKLAYFFRNRKRNKENQEITATADNAPGTAGQSVKKGVGRILWLFYELLIEYFCKYRISGILPKDRRPQTIIVLARKR